MFPELFFLSPSLNLQPFFLPFVPPQSCLGHLIKIIFQLINKKLKFLNILSTTLSQFYLSWRKTIHKVSPVSELPLLHLVVDRLLTENKHIRHQLIVDILRYLQLNHRAVLTQRVQTRQTHVQLQGDYLVRGYVLREHLGRTRVRWRLQRP